MVGLGAVAGTVVREVARRGLPNVAITNADAPVGWQDILGPPRGDLDMIVIVCGEEDERLFRPDAARPKVLVTFVLLEQGPSRPRAKRR